MWMKELYRNLDTEVHNIINANLYKNNGCNHALTVR